MPTQSDMATVMVPHGVYAAVVTVSEEPGPEQLVALHTQTVMGNP